MKKILIVDDEKNIQVSLATVLEDEGYQVYFAKDGREGIEKFKNIKPDAIFLDIWLPGMDGLEVINRILAIDPLQIIIMISGHGSVSAAVSALKAGAYDFLEKPLSLDKVIFVLKRGLEFRHVRDENMKLRTILDQEDQLAGNDEKKLSRKHGDHRLRGRRSAVSAQAENRGSEQHHLRHRSPFGEKNRHGHQAPAANKGIRFENISKRSYIPARIEYLNTTGYATSIKKDDLEARTIEHLLAVLHAFGITNLAVKINKEVPIDDGSAITFCEFIKECGIVDQAEDIPDIVITRPLLVGEETRYGRFIKIEPAEVFSVKYTCIYPEPLGRQSYDFVMRSGEDFKREIAPARDLWVRRRLQQAQRHGVGRGRAHEQFHPHRQGPHHQHHPAFPRGAGPA